MIIGTIKRIVKAIFKGVYSVISFLNLQYPLLVLLVGLILYVTGIFDKNQSIFVIFWVILGLSVLLSLSLNFRRLTPNKNTNKDVKEKPLQDNENQNSHRQISEHSDNITDSRIEQNYYSQNQVVEDKPLRYFRVKQNPNYVVGEYLNRYELYLKTQGGLKRIRTDYK